MDAPARKIMVILSWTRQYDRQVLRGLRDYAWPARRWIFHTQEAPGPLMARVRAWNPDGIVAAVSDAVLGRQLAALKKPVVDVALSRSTRQFPRVSVAESAVGRVAAEHLVARGLRRFAMPGSAEVNERCRGFQEELSLRGFEVLTPPRASLRTSAKKRVESFDEADRYWTEWLRSLPRRTGLFVPKDADAWHMAELCFNAGIRVPDDLAIVGGNNDEHYCHLALPPVSSVALPEQEVGYEAGVLLDRLMNGEAPPDRALLLQPLDVVARASTDVVASDDPELLSAVRYLRDHAFESVSVDDLLEAVPLSRRSLERRFREALGRTPLEVLTGFRLERAQHLLATTDLPLRAVAVRCGLADAQQLWRLFRRETGDGPGQYRARYRRTPSQVAPHRSVD